MVVAPVASTINNNYEKDTKIKAISKMQLTN